ncbi:MAG: hypothetical protein ACR2MA_13460 [Egibacteraceae bacterium]
MAIWTEWLAVLKQQRHHRDELDRLGRNLAHRDPQPDRTADKAALTDDLDELYRLTVEAKLSTPSGRVYVPSRFKQAIDRARNGADPVQLVTRICRHASEGFDVLLAHDRPDLTVEQLVVDAARPYHDLFGAQTLELSSQRLEEFPSGHQTAKPLPGAAPSAASGSARSKHLAR